MTRPGRWHRSRITWTRLFYERLIGCVECKTGPEKILMTFLKREVDVANLMTLLKLKREGVDLEKIGNYFIEGGQELSVKELTRLASMESFEATVGETVQAVLL